MNIKDLYNTFKELVSDNLSFIYQGDFRDEITSKIINLSEYNISNISELSKMKKKVSLIMVECFQNIIRHGNDVDKSIEGSIYKSKIFISRNIGQTYYVTSANLVENDMVPFLTSKLEQINGLNKEELKALYIEVLSNDEVSKKGGAGLGLIEMARKSGEKLEYDFDKITDTHSYFYLQAKINNSDTTGVLPKVDIPIQVAKEFHKKMLSWNILMIYKGDFSQSSIMPVLKMIENNMMNQFEELRVKKLVYIALVEVLQNIVKHSKPNNGLQEGIFLMGKKGTQYVISSGNLIENTDIPEFKNQLEKINSLSREELNQLYKDTLLKEEDTIKGGAGLGLIDIARESRDKLEYEFIPFGNDISFFSLMIKV